MKITRRSLLLLTLVACALGCASSAPPKKLPYDEVRLGISPAEAAQIIGREGRPCDYDKLPVVPPPRIAYKHIPASTTWVIWWKEKEGFILRPELVLGILDGRVIYKQIVYEEQGELTSKAWALPEYQR